jgi:hypothetical protein
MATLHPLHERRQPDSLGEPQLRYRTDLARREVQRGDPDELE